MLTGKIEKRIFRDIICKSVGVLCPEEISYGYEKVNAVVLNRRFIKDVRGENDR